jgi:hypothetical protein
MVVISQHLRVRLNIKQSRYRLGTLLFVPALQDERFNRWIAALEERHLANLTFSEVSRALRALSSAYVERRGPEALGKALSGEGKRAAFALFYGPLHFLLTSHILRSVPPGDVHTVVDLGCGTGVAGAAWGCQCVTAPSIVGVDRHPWSLTEAAATYRAFDFNARVRRGDALEAVPTKGTAGIIATFVVNELPAEIRRRLLARLLERAKRGDRIVIIEPLARSIAPWWDEWTDAFAGVGGRADEWRFPIDRPAIVAKLDRAAGLDHRETSGRSIIKA